VALGAEAVLTIKVLVDAAKAKAGIKETKAATGSFADTVGKLAKPAAVVFGAITAGAIAAGKAAAEDAQGQALLAQSMTNAAHASKAQISATEDWIAAQAKATGVADDQLRPALSSLVRATGDVAQAQSALTLAMDISAATGKPLQSISDALAKGYAGNTTALGRLVPGISKAAMASKDMSKITAELARKTGGSAARAAATEAGQMAIATDQMHEAEEAIGAGLLPVMAALAGILKTVAEWVQRNTTVVLVLVGVIAALAAAILVVNVAMKAYAAAQALVTAAQWAWNVAMDANPIGLIILAIAAVVVGLILLWKNSSKVRALLTSMWSAIASAARACWAAISSAAAAVWRAVTNGASAVRAFMVGVWNGIRSAGMAVWGGITAAARNAFAPLITLAHQLASAFNTVVDAVKSVVSWLGRIKVPKISLPHIPGITSAAAGVGVSVARAGAPSLRGLTGASATQLATSGGTTFNLYGILGAEDAARRIRAVLRDDDRRRMGVRTSGRRT
jgi:hypothetical protein